MGIKVIKVIMNMAMVRYEEKDRNVTLRDFLDIPLLLSTGVEEEEGGPDGGGGTSG